MSSSRDRSAISAAKPGLFGAKIKAATLVPIVGDGGDTNVQWSRLYQEGLPARLDALSALGANAVQTGVPDQAIPDFAERVSWYVSLLRARDLRLCVTLTGARSFTARRATTAVNLAQPLANLRSLLATAGDIVAVIDLCNEVNFNGPTTWSTTTNLVDDLQWLLSKVRRYSGSIPLSFSVYLNSVADVTGALVQAQAYAGCDYHNLHPYYGKNGSTALRIGVGPTASDFAALEAADWFLGSHYIGECGLEMENSDAVVSDWVENLGSVAALPRSLGACLFSDVDYDSPSETGHYGWVGRVAAQRAFSAWPERLI